MGSHVVSQGTIVIWLLLSTAVDAQGPATSLLDRLDLSKLPVEDRPDGAPKGTVAFIRAHNRAAASVAFSPDMSVLASTSLDNTLRLWKLGGPTPVTWATLEGSPSGLSFSPDGKLLAAGNRSTSVTLWDLSDERPRRKTTLPGHNHRPFAVTFSPTGKMLATACNDPLIRIWRWDNGVIEAWAVLDEDRKDSFGISALSFSPDGRKLAAGSFAGKHGLRLWDVGGAFMEESRLPDLPARVVAFSPDNQTLAFAAADAGVFLWDLKKSKLLRRVGLPAQTPRLGAPALNSLAFTHEGRALVIAKGQQILLVETATGRQLAAWDFPADINAVSMASDGRHIAVGDKGGDIYIVRLRK